CVSGYSGYSAFDYW
nr:immunoglobulin heavy chain junction region [Macaca mulatta]